MPGDCGRFTEKEMNIERPIRRRRIESKKMKNQKPSFKVDGLVKSPKIGNFQNSHIIISIGYEAII